MVQVADTKTIDELRASGDLSVRASNVCQRNRIKNLNALLAFYQKHEDFMLLRGIGTKTNHELKKFCKGIAHEEKIAKANKPHFLQEAYADLNENAKQLFDNKVERLRLSLSTRTNNILNNLCQVSSSANIISNFCDFDFEFSNIRNAGEKTISELEFLTEKFVQILNEVKSPGVVEGALFENFYRFLKDILGVCKPTLVGFLKANFKSLSTEGFPLLKCLEMCLLESELVKERERRLIFAKRRFIDCDEDLETVAAEYDITKERVRQLTIDERVEIIFWRPIEILFKRLRDSGLNATAALIDGLEKDVFFINSADVNEEANTAFSQEFLTNAVAKFSNQYTVFCSEQEDVYFLVHRDLAALADINSLLQKIEETISQKVSESFQINLGGFIHQFLQTPSDDWNILKRLQNAVETILARLYGLVTDLDGNLEIVRNTKKRAWEHVEDVLKKEGTALHVSIISQRLVGIGVEMDAATVRSQALRMDKVFVLAGQSTYGLKAWEATGQFLGGTIKRIMLNYMDTQDEPVHVFEILKYVKQYRNTNLRSLLGIIQLDTQGHFQNFGQLFYGLTKKKYNASQTSFNEMNRHWFNDVTKTFFESSTTVPAADIIAYVVEKYMVKAIQVEHLLAQRVDEHKILIQEDNTVRLT